MNDTPVTIGSVRPGSIVKIAERGVFSGSGRPLAQKKEITVIGHTLQVTSITYPFHGVTIESDTLPNETMVIIVKEAPDPLKN